ncbi:uncharacterized protein LOC126896517 [Daktulosphaira vitifoliae]|uniref:uncharacterized protein LOC126896517 n=1 Tax=Daktulosphaira vitifoliae TaxID=58002 RepID=UPI0021AA0FBF|nr:uncharacterized protein LOC126896517 [Daktulosphaira vitifoliae]
MRTLPFVFLLLMGMTWRCVLSTCVLETDFGLTLNCGLKKSGMFRVRNLGGLKGYVGLGIQLADELGFKESLSTLEQNKRRSVNGFPAPGSFEPLEVLSENSQMATNLVTSNADRTLYAKMNGKTKQVPPFRPLIAVANNIVRNVRLAQQQPLLKPLPVPAFAALPESIAKVTVAPTVITPSNYGVPNNMVSNRISNNFLPNNFAKNVVPNNLGQSLLLNSMVVPSTIPQMRIQTPQQQQFSMQNEANRRFAAFTRNPQNSIDTRPVYAVAASVEPNHEKLPSYGKKAEKQPLSNEVDPVAMTSLFNVAAANNVSVEQLAIALRHQQQRVPYSPVLPASTTTVSAATSTTPLPPITIITTEAPPVTKKILMKPFKSKYGSGQKVMNAPKEYYPVGYDKNFDDNFTSKVDLPDTSFSCGNQKHFPGLYSDEDLGCMVFHVCAFTDEGLTQKSFLCPESTLFDQTILKCNWWFYVDCKSSKKLYDSNIPISKSYQLMKALTFFSTYNSGPMESNNDDKSSNQTISENPSSPTLMSNPASPINITEVLQPVTAK